MVYLAPAKPCNTPLFPCAIVLCYCSYPIVLLLIVIHLLSCQANPFPLSIVLDSPESVPE
jgi:hypothetical protein